MLRFFKDLTCLSFCRGGCDDDVSAVQPKKTVRCEKPEQPPLTYTAFRDADMKSRTRSPSWNLFQRWRSSSSDTVTSDSQDEKDFRSWNHYVRNGKVRGSYGRNRASVLDDTVLKIQSAWRGHSSRRKIMRRSDAARVIQKSWREVLVRREENEAATQIQKTWRRREAQKRVAEMLREQQQGGRGAGYYGYLVRIVRAVARV